MIQGVDAFLNKLEGDVVSEQESRQFRGDF